MFRYIFDEWLDRPGLDWAICAAIAMLGKWRHLEGYLVIAEKGAFYQTAAGLSLGLLSLGAVAVTLVVTVTPTIQLRQALAEAGRDLVNTMFHCLFGLVGATLGFTALFFLDPSREPNWWFFILVLSFSMMLLRAARLLWVLHRILLLLI